MRLINIATFVLTIVCIDYFSKWSEAKPITEKTAPTIAQFLYEMMCRHCCFAIQFNDQGREFVKEVSDELHLATAGSTAGYKCLSVTIKRQKKDKRQKQNSLVKVLEEKQLKWSSITEGVLIAHHSVNIPLQSIPLSSYCTIENQYYQQM